MTRNWLAICDSCGRRFKGTDLRERWDGALVCEADWEPRHPQDFPQPASGNESKSLPWTRNDPDLVNPGASDIQPSNVFDTDGAIGESDINVGGSTDYVIINIMEGTDVPIITLPDAGGKTVIINNWGDIGVIYDQYGQTVTVQGTGVRTPAEASFTTEPTGVGVNETFTCAVSAIWKGSVISEYVGNITVAVATGAGTLSGTTTVAAVAGVASFTDLSLDTADTYTLSATSADLTTDTSAAFEITAAAEVITVTRADLGEGYSFGFQTGIGGSRSPTTLFGQTILDLFCPYDAGSDRSTYLRLSGNVSQSFFTTIAGETRTLNSADATTFSTGGGETYWRWTGGSGNEKNVFNPTTGNTDVTFTP